MIQKILVVALACFAHNLLVNGLTEAEIDKQAQACKNTITNATDNDVKAVMQVTTPMTKIQGCIVNCLFKKFNIVDSSKKINATAFVEVFADGSDEKSAESGEVAELLKAMKTCTDKYSDKDDCIAAKNYIECVADKMKE